MEGNETHGVYVKIAKGSQSFVIVLQVSIHFISHSVKLFHSDTSYKAVKDVFQMALGSEV